MHNLRMTTELLQSVYTNYFRMNRNQLCEVHQMITPSIEADECNAQKPIGTEKKTVFLR